MSKDECRLAVNGLRCNQLLRVHAHNPLASLTPAGVTSGLGLDITNLRDLRCAAGESGFLQPACVRIYHTSPGKGHFISVFSNIEVFSVYFNKLVSLTFFFGNILMVF